MKSYADTEIAQWRRKQTDRNGNPVWPLRLSLEPTLLDARRVAPRRVALGDGM